MKQNVIFSSLHEVNPSSIEMDGTVDTIVATKAYHSLLEEMQMSIIIS